LPQGLSAVFVADLPAEFLEGLSAVFVAEWRDFPPMEGLPAVCRAGLSASSVAGLTPNSHNKYNILALKL